MQLLRCANDSLKMLKSFIRYSLLLSFVILFYYWMLSSLKSKKIKTSFGLKLINECDDSQRVSKSDTIMANNVNNDKKYECVDRLIYNRVPKCGGTSFIALLQRLSKLNHFIHINSKIYDQRRINSEQQDVFIKQLMEFRTPLSYDRHIYYIDFNGHKLANRVIYINLIRDPIERVISSFFYRRSVAYKSRSRITTNDSWINKSFESCVLEEDYECSENNSYVMSIVPYFCGQNDRCLKMNDKWALEEAKRNIESSYAVIGILEHMDITLEVLTQVLPKYFAGVSQLYDKNKPIRLNENHSKANVSQRARRKLRTVLGIDYQMYEYCRQRLFSQLRQIKSSSGYRL